jgi:phosphoglycerate dehydrogenase-like enzyme
LTENKVVFENLAKEDEMKTIRFAIALAGLIITGAVLAGPTPEAQSITEELELRAADKPISANPAWQPKRVVVSLPDAFSARLPGFEQLLITAAGDAELVIDRSNGFTPSADTLAGADAIIGLCTPSTMKNAGKSLLWLHNYFVGMDRCTGLTNIQLEQTVFTNSKRLSGPAIAEHSIAMMLSLARGLPAFHRAQAAGKWQQNLARSVRFGEVEGKTILVVGLGGIGTQIARRAHGLGMRVIAIRNSSREGPDYVDYVGLPDELHKLAGDADVIVNALPLTPQTSGLFDKDFFSSAKTGSMFLSVGRGKSTVTGDLVSALQSGQIFAAGLDVTDPEPLPADSPLWQMENVIITPHISASGADSLRRVAVITVENLRRYVAGEALLNVVDMQAGY